MKPKAKSIQFKWVSVDAIVPNEWNPNVVPPELMGKVKRSLEEFGMVAPIIVRPRPDGKYELIDGEHRWRIAREEGFKEVPTIIVEGLSDVDAKRISLALNRLHGEDDVVRLADLLTDLAGYVSIDDICSITPYDQDTITTIMEWGLLSTSWEDLVEAGRTLGPLRTLREAGERTASEEGSTSGEKGTEKDKGEDIAALVSKLAEPYGLEPKMFLELVKGFLRVHSSLWLEFIGKVAKQGAETEQVG
jgi:ParB/RepB/Spo0J family partition protein